MKLPSFQFYPGDWRKDPNLRRCSAAARGVWIDVLCLMFECEDRGVLSTGGVPWGLEEVAGAVGGDTAANLACVNELLSKGVASRNKAGAIVCRRMVRDEEIRRMRATVGSEGGKQSASKRQANHQAKRKQITEDEDEGVVAVEGTGQNGPPKPRARTVRDDLWDAVAAAWFGGSVAEPDEPRVGKLVSALVKHKANPADIPDRIERYKRKHPTWECTPESVLKWWAQLAPPKAIQPKPKDNMPPGFTPEQVAEMREQAAREAREANDALRRKVEESKAGVGTIGRSIKDLVPLKGADDARH